MSLLINNDLIWVAIPKCASISVAQALENSSLTVDRYNYTQNVSKTLLQQFPINNHVRKKELVEYFGGKKTFCVKRDWFERWVSSISQLWFTFESTRIKPKVGIEDVDNNFIYSIFDSEFVKILYNVYDKKLFITFLKKLINNPETLDNIQLFFIRSAIFTFRSQNFFTENESCDFEFDIKKLNVLENFILDRYGVEIKIEHKNVSNSKPTNIILDQELKEYLWNILEAPFAKQFKFI